MANIGGQKTHPTLTQNKNINNLNVGEYINCNYSYEDGFTNFYNGDNLNFICVETSRKQSILVSDTVIPNLSFDDINNKGFIYGNDIGKVLGGNNICTVRSLSGGSVNNGTSEYDEYIVKSDLSGVIVAGDNNIWHWNLETVTSSTLSTDGSKVITRGVSNVDSYTSTNIITSKSETLGFRPLLVIDHLYVPPMFTISNGFGEYGGTIDVSDITLDSSTITSIVSFDVAVDGVANIVSDVDISTGSCSINLAHLLAGSGSKNIDISVIDENNVESEVISFKSYTHDKGFVKYHKSFAIGTTDISPFTLAKVKTISSGKVILAVDNGTSVISKGIGESFSVSNNLKATVLMDIDSTVDAYSFAGIYDDTFSFDNTPIKDIPSSGSGGGGTNTSAEFEKCEW